MLCYADLRPAQPPAPPPVPVAAQVPAPAHAAVAAGALATHAASSSDDLDPLTAPLALLEQPEPSRGRHAAPEEPTAAADRAGWPCLKCGELVAIDDSACSACGAGFLESVDTDSSLHRFGLHTGQVSNQLKVFIMVGGSVGLLVVLVGLMYVVGMVF